MMRYFFLFAFMFFGLFGSFSLGQNNVEIPNGPSSDPALYQQYCPYDVGTDQYNTCMSCMSECEAVDWGLAERCACKCGGGISLNTDVPFIGSCILMRWNNTQSWSAENVWTTVNQTTAFPRLIWWLSRILVTAILVFSFVMIIVGWVMMTMGWADQSQYDKGKSYIIHVVIALALLGSSGLILRLINPNFFG